MIKREVGCCDYVETENDVFFSALDHHIICKVNKDTEKLHILAKDNEKNIAFTASTIAECNGKIFFAPLNLNNLYVYDIHTSSLSVIPVQIRKEQELFGDKSGSEKYWTTYVYNGSVYFFGWHYMAIMKVNADSLKIEYITDFIKPDISGIVFDDSSIYSFFANGYVIIGNYLYIASGLSSGLWKMSLDVSCIEYIEIQSRFKGFLSISEIDEKIVLTANNEKEEGIIIWNPIDYSLKEIKILEPGGWRFPINYNGDIYLIPGWGNNHILKVNPLSGKCERFNQLDILLNDQPNDSFASVKQKGSRVTFVRSSDNCWFSYNFERNQLTKKYYKIEDDDVFLEYKKRKYDEKYNKEIKNNYLIQEKEIPLIEYLSRI